MTLLRDNRALLDAFRRGDMGALEAVYRHYVDKVAAVVRHGTLAGADGRVAGAPAHAQHDLIQDTFVRAFAEPARLAYDGLRPYQPYLLTVCRNLVIEFWRKRGREVELPEDVELVEPEEAQAIDPATLAAVEEYVRALPDELSMVYDKLYVVCLSQNDSASALGLSRQRIRTLNAKLRKGLEQFLRRRKINPK